MYMAKEKEVNIDVIDLTQGKDSIRKQIEKRKETIDFFKELKQKLK